jgi:epoxyqueuosine reductase
MDINWALEKVTFSEGATLFGVAPVERFAGAPSGHHPRDFLEKARNVVVIGVPIPEGVLFRENMMKGSPIVPEEERLELLQNYFYHSSAFEIVNTRLEQISLRLSLLLQEKGCRTLFFTPTFGKPYNKYYEKYSFAPFSHRHAAVRAGLGEFGLNNLVVNPKYGPRVRYNSIITEAELSATPLLEEETCLGSSCAKCLEGCPGKAIAGANIPLKTHKPDNNIVRLDPVSSTNHHLCIKSQENFFCQGRCLAVCPVGMEVLD